MGARAEAVGSGQTVLSAPPVSLRPAISGFSPRREDAIAHVLARIPAVVLVISAGAISTAIYTIYTLGFPITRWYNHPHLDSDSSIITDMGQITHFSPFAAIAFVLAVVTLFVCQFLAYSAIGRRTSAGSVWLKRVALLFPAVWVLILIWMQPVTSTDLYGYVARGYLYTHLHLNPMTNPAFLLPGSLLVSRPPAPYGPLWMLIAGAFSAISGDNLLLNMLLFKAVGALGVLSCSLLIYFIARRIKPNSVEKIVLFFAWNPLVLWEEVANGHNDVVMMAFVLAALLLVVRRHAHLALALLVLGALVKYTAGFLIPLWLVYELGHLRPLLPAMPSGARARRSRATRASRGLDRSDKTRPVGAGNVAYTSTTARRGQSTQRLSEPSPTLAGSARTAWMLMRDLDRKAALRLAGGGAAIAIGLAALFYAPFWQGLRTFSGLGQQVRPLYYNGSLVQFLVAPLELFVPADSYGSLDKTIRLAFYALFILYAWIQAHRLWLAGPTATPSSLITAGAKVMFAALLLIAFWFQPWYVVWLLPLAALADETFVRSQAAILSLGSLMTYAVAYYLFVHETGIGQSLFVQVSEVVVTFLPLLLLRIVPVDRGWPSVVRGYVRLVIEAVRVRPAIWDRVMLGLILIVAVLLRLVRLGNLFGSISADNPSPSILRQVTGDLRLYLADPHGLDLPFALLQRFAVYLFGQTPFALLLPSAIIGSFTVWLIYLVTTLIFADGPATRARTIGLLAALLAATSQWHVSLSRAGMQVVVLPLLVCLALYLLLLAWRASPDEVRPVYTRHAAKQRHHPHAGNQRSNGRLLTRRTMLFLGSGVVAGLASDLAPGLWLLPVLVLAAALIALVRRPAWFKLGSMHGRSGLWIMVVGVVVAGGPGAWQYYFSQFVSPVATSGGAHSSSPSISHLLAAIGTYLSQAGSNLLSVLRLLAAQDYSAAWPTTGGTPILPAIVWIFFYVGVLIIVLRWRTFSSLMLLMLLAFPLLASVAVGSRLDIIQAASALPATCIIPALALYECGRVVGRLPIVFDRANGVRVFATPERIGRVLLMVFLLFSALRTFYWYFQATLPLTPPNTNLPT